MQSFREALGAALLDLGRQNPKVVAVTPDLANAVKIQAFKREFPDRFVTVGVSEADCLSFAAGLAAAGFTPVVVGFAMFVAEKAFEQIRNAIAYPRLNVTIIATHAGLCVGRDGATHQALEDMAVMRTLPGFTVLAAADAAETAAAIRAAAAHPGPVYLRLGRDESKPVFPEGKAFAIGAADLLAQGDDLTLVACGLMTANALEAAQALAMEGIRARVLNMGSVKPLDTPALLAAARETGALVTVEDHSVIGGLGSAVLEALSRHVAVPVEMVGVADVFGESGSQEELYAKYGLDVPAIMAAARRALARKKGGERLG